MWPVVGEVSGGARNKIHCVVCLEEHGRIIRVHCWEELVEPQEALRLVDA